MVHYRVMGTARMRGEIMPLNKFIGMGHMENNQRVAPYYMLMSQESNTTERLSNNNNRQENPL